MGTAARSAFGDVASSFYRIPLALRLALDDIQGRYRRTVLGPLWITLGQAATISGFLTVHAHLFGIEPAEYALYLSAGFPVWVFISHFMTDMPLAFINARGMIESFGLPWTLQIWRRTIGYALIFCHHIAILVVVMITLRTAPTPTMFLAIPALAIVAAAGAGLGLTLAILGARYRDLQPAMAVAMALLFIFSPVMWKAEQLQVNEWVLRFNPFYYYLSLVRDPLLGHAPSVVAWISTGLGAAALLAIGYITLLLSRRRLFHWL